MLMSAAQEQISAPSWLTVLTRLVVIGVNVSLVLPAMDSSAQVINN